MVIKWYRDYRDKYNTAMLSKNHMQSVYYTKGLQGLGTYVKDENKHHPLGCYRNTSLVKQL